jgi:hypothetical protein
MASLPFESEVPSWPYPLTLPYWHGVSTPGLAMRSLTRSVTSREAMACLLFTTFPRCGVWVGVDGYYSKPPCSI